MLVPATPMERDHDDAMCSASSSARVVSCAGAPGHPARDRSGEGRALHLGGLGLPKTDDERLAAEKAREVALVYEGLIADQAVDYGDLITRPTLLMREDLDFAKPCARGSRTSTSTNTRSEPRERQARLGNRRRRTEPLGGWRRPPINLSLSRGASCVTNGAGAAVRERNASLPQRQRPRMDSVQ